MHPSDTKTARVETAVCEATMYVRNRGNLQLVKNLKEKGRCSILDVQCIHTVFPVLWLYDVHYSMLQSGMCTLTLRLCLVYGACVRKNRVCLWLALGCRVLLYPYQSNPKKTLQLATRVGYGERKWFSRNISSAYRRWIHGVHGALARLSFPRSELCSRLVWRSRPFPS